MFQNNNLCLFNIFKERPLIIAIENGCVEIVKLLLEQKGIDINAKSIYLFHLEYISIILYFKIIISVYSTYLMKLHLKPQL